MTMAGSTPVETGRPDADIGSHRTLARRLRRLGPDVLVVLAALTVGASVVAVLEERILELMPTLEVTIVADARETTDAYRVGRGD